MSKPTIDLTGKRFGRLVVIEKSESTQDKKVRWLCQCDCGNQCIVRATCLLRKDFTKSCGCIKREVASETYKKIGTNSKKHNIYDLTGEFGIGYTLKGEEFYFDLEDYNKIKDYCWNAHINQFGYKSLEARQGEKNVKFQWLVLGKNYDHANRNSLDNRKSNLRKANLQENNRNHSLRKDNTSGISGVNWNKRRNKWCARINNNDKERISLGYFDDIKDAIIARLQAEKKYYGEFAPQKHLYKEYGIDE